MRLLLVEDEKEIAEPLAKMLRNMSFAVDYAGDGKTAYDMASVNQYDCIILDLNLPVWDGIKVAEALRSDKNTTPILMLTARTQQKDVWAGFESGTDDYMTKPFDTKELILRINAIIKRNSREKDEALSAGNLILVPKQHKVTIGGNPVFLNNKEFGILEYLLRNRGTVVSSEDLLEHVWDGEVDMFTQTVRTNIKTLRQKLGPDNKLIQTIRGRGYVIR